MRITVIGASGRTGRELVKQALAHGDEVAAFVRTPAKIADMEHERLSVFRGDVLDPGSFDQAICGSDAVMFAVGTGRGLDPANIYSDGVHHTIASMDRCGASRLICVTAAGVGDPKDPNLPKLWGRLFVSVVLRQVYADMERLEHEVMLSETNWTIVRPHGLTDGPLTGEYRVAEGRSLPGGKTISRADVAAFMLKAAAIDVWDRSGVAIAY